MSLQGVIKPDQLIKRRGKHGLVKIGSTSELKKWFDEKKGSYAKVLEINVLSTRAKVIPCKYSGWEDHRPTLPLHPRGRL